MYDQAPLTTDVPNLDDVLGGGVVPFSLNVLAGEPGTGKTILAQHILFNRVGKTPGSKAVYVSTLSEPVLNVVRYMQRFDFFDTDLFGERILYQDVGESLRASSLEETLERILALVTEHEADLLVIDSFKAISEMATSQAEFRRFCFDISLRLSTTRCTTFLVGEYKREDVSNAAEFAVADGIILLSLQTVHGERQRRLQVLKMRGQAPITRSTPFVIGKPGIRLLHDAGADKGAPAAAMGGEKLLPTGIPGLDALLRGGLPRGKSILLSGASGTGKTTLCLQVLSQAAQHGHKGLYFSFEESPQNLENLGEALGFGLQELLQKGLLRIIHTPISFIRVEEDMEAMVRAMQDLRPDFYVVDSSSVYLHRMVSEMEQREKIWQIGGLANDFAAVGLLVSDVPAGENGRLSRFGVEETMADGVIVLSSELVQGRRKRFLEVYKMRQRPLIEGRHYMEIGGQGLEVFHFGFQEDEDCQEETPLVFNPVLQLMDASLPYNSSWLCRGEPGVGKSTMALQFAKQGLERGEAVLVITLDGPVMQVERELAVMGVDAAAHCAEGNLAFVDAYAPGGPDFRNWDAFLYAIRKAMKLLKKPLRIVLDSLTPVRAVYGHGAMELIHLKNRLLLSPGVAIFDTTSRLATEGASSDIMANFYDVMLELFTPDWGDMRSAGSVSLRALQITKARGVKVDTQPYPYSITPEEGISIHTEFYQRVGST